MSTGPGDRSPRSTTDGASIPLCVDLDGTLVRTDTLIESFVCLIRHNPLLVFPALLWLLAGRSRFKAEIASRITFDAEHLPVNRAFVDWLGQEHGAGRRLVLCTAANRRIAEAVAARFGIFDRIIASDGDTNLRGAQKAAALTAEFGRGGFDYAGNDPTDLPVWAAARHAVVVEPSVGLRRRIDRIGPIERRFLGAPPSFGVWLRALRPHQWTKNLLVFVPAVAAQEFLDLPVLGASLVAFVLFSLCASGTYLVNDLLDVEADRRHPTKRGRPIAAGNLPIAQAVVGAVILIVGSVLTGAVLLGLPFALVVIIYIAATLGYSLLIKRLAMVDVLTLSGLYTTRLAAGGVATGIVLSFWLVAFSTFIFLSLAIAKRCAELKMLQAQGVEAPAGRGYVASDLPLLLVCGVASGYVAVLVLALYINAMFGVGDAAPTVQWLLCPLMIYWINRIWIKTHRDQMHDDPIVFALRDWPSMATLAVTILLFIFSG